VNVFSKTLAVTSAAFLVASAMATGVTGVWHGRLKVKLPPQPAGATAEQKKAVVDSVAKAQQINFLLTLKADKTFSMVLSGGMFSKPQTATGNWTQTGSKITVTATKNNGLAAKSAKPQSLVVSKDGKSLAARLPAPQVKQASLTFTR